MSRYINPFTDFGFKHLFGSENNKDILISFLNAVLPDQKIATLAYKNVERLGISEAERKVIFDLHCENEKGEKFIVELQRAKQEYFKDRTIYYSTFPIQEQAVRGEDWDYKLKHVYTVSILNFRFDNPITKKKDTSVKHIVKLINAETNEVFYDKLTFVYLQMPNFKKTEDELETIEDKWYYVLSNLEILERMPAPLQEKIFSYFFDSAELAKLPRPTRMEYEESLKQLRDWKNVMRTLEKDSREDERLKTERRVRKEEQEKFKAEQEKAKQNLKEEQEKAKQKEIESIKNMVLKTDLSTAQIADILNVSKELVEQVKNQKD